MLLNIIIGLAAIIILLLIAALFVKKVFVIERSIIIDKPQHEVFQFLKYLKNQDKYSKWVMADPAMKKEYTGTDGTVGFIYAWDSDNKKVGKGEQEIKGIIQDGRLDYEIRFIKPFEGTATSYLITQPLTAGQTQVTWVFTNKMKYPMNLVCLVMNMDEMLGGDMETSLKTLQQQFDAQNMSRLTNPINN
jgi:hypothetical protein